MKKISLFLGVILGFSVAQAKLEVATTTTDLAALVKEVGQDRVDVFAIAKGTQDPHQIEAKPSFMVKLRKVDLILAHGLDLETAWLQPLIQGARSPKLKESQALLELAASLDPLEVPKTVVSRAEGDVHPGGNPHFQLDPIRLGQAAVLIAERLGSLESSSKEFFLAKAHAFQKRMVEKNKEWQNRIQKTAVTEIVTYHKMFIYFCERYAIQCTLQLEPKPGIPPTASHLVNAIEQMKKRKIRMVWIENIFRDSVGEKIRQSLPEAKVFRVPVSVGGEPEILTSEQLIEKLVETLEKGKF